MGRFAGLLAKFSGSIKTGVLKQSILVGIVGILPPHNNITCAEEEIKEEDNNKKRGLSTWSKSMTRRVTAAASPR